jgi:hypothetical protein
MKRLILRNVWMAMTLLLSALITNAQVLDSENKIAVTLKDGTQVILYGKAGSAPGSKTNEYYYLPTALRLSRNSQGDPEFLFLKYVTDAREDVGGVSGALMHFLMEWGLNDAQVKEAQEKVKAKNASAKIMGPAAVETDGERSFEVKSAVLSSNGQTLITSGSAPVMPGSKVVTAAKMDKYAAQLLVNTFDKAASDVSLSLRFKYRVLMPAAKGRIVIDWSKIYSKYQKDSATFTSNEKKTSALFGLINYTTTSERSYKEVRTEVESLISQKYIDFQFDELDPNSEKVKPIREGFMNMLTQMMGDLNQSVDNKPPSPEEAEAMPDIKTGTSYKFSREKFVKRVQRGREVLNLNYRSTYYSPVDITQNLTSWYTDLKNNPKCVASVNLNDPFFDKRDINFVLDETSKDMFDDKEINYVTVNVRKKRSTGGDFTGRFTIDKKYLSDKGLRATLTYARGDDKNTDEFEYQSQWSFAGGYVYPTSGGWEKGSWESNPLAAPLQLHKLEFQTDLDKLKEANIVRASLQVRFKKFGEEREVTLPISVSGSDPMASKNIYTDKNLNGYAYRIIYYTNDGTRLATEWSAQLSDWFVYAAVPDDLKDKTSELFKKAVDAGKAILGSGTDGGKVSNADKILDKFKDVLGIITN